MPLSALILAAILALPPDDVLCDASPFPARAARPTPAGQSTRDVTSGAINRTRALVDQVIAASYPDLKDADIGVRPLRSRSDYFKARFGVPQFFFGRMRYRVFVNPTAFELRASEEGLRAIIAHELAHIVYYRRRKRVQLVGLVRLMSKEFSAEFERRADLRAIALGYGQGLKEYRRWLYRNIPPSKVAEKRRNYFSPEEIDALVSASSKRPELLEYWDKHVPLSLDQILATK